MFPNFPISPVNTDIFRAEVVYLDYAGAALFSRAQLAATQAPLESLWPSQLGIQWIYKGDIMV